MDKVQKETGNQKEITFGKLSAEALPEIWTFQIFVGIIMAIPALIMFKLIDLVAGAGGEVVTTANIKSFLLSWKFPVLLILGFLLALIYLVFELLTQIYMTDSILNGQKAGVKKCAVSGVKSVKKFMNPTGIGAIVFILIAVPLCGVGLSLSLSESFYIPNFIMEVVFKNPLFTAAYVAAILALIWIAFHSLFLLHAVLLDGMTPSEGKKYSSRIVKEHRWEFLKDLILTLVVLLVIAYGSSFILSKVPGLLLSGWGESLPKHYKIDFAQVMKTGGEFSAMDIKVMVFRSVAAFAVLVVKYLSAIISFLCVSYFMLCLTKYYLDFTGRGHVLWPERPMKALYRWKVVLIIVMFLIYAVIGVYLGLNYNTIFTSDIPVKIVAHRAGGTMASENSLEGLEKAIEHGCYASEIDVQRTKDGYYIINHDNDFARLTGVAKAPEEMTLAEIKELRIKDTTGNGQELEVPTFEEMLDVIKGKIKLFVELKGATADKQMVDDVVRIIKEHDCVEDTALISLDYGIIKYAEETYPEFETGTLFFASLGDVSSLSCDLLIMEEETATDTNIRNIHKAGKQAIAWTVNTEDGLYHFLDTWLDAVITDEIILAEEVQAKLDNRTDLQVMEDLIYVII